MKLLKIPYTIIILTFLFIFSFYIRGILPYENTFMDDLIYFAADDAVYHMRLVENLVHNFPHKIWFDLFTNYPNGQTIHFGPMWTYLIATTSLIIGIGNPSTELIRTIGAFYPSVFGALMVFPIYVIGKEVFNKYIGLLSAFMICIMPGQFLNRSTLGFTDHHIGEVLFSTLTIMFLILAINRMSKYTLNDLKSKKIINGLIYSVLAGLSFSCYLLQWSSGLFFISIIMPFIILQFIIIHSNKKQSVEGLMVVFSVMFITASLPMLSVMQPGFASVHYSYLHVLLTSGSGLFVIGLGLLSIELNKRKMVTYYYPLIIFGFYFISIAILKNYIPTLYNNVEQFFNIFTINTDGQATIAEAMPANKGQLLNSYPGIVPALSSYNLAFIGLITLAITNLKSKSKSLSLFLIWSVMIFWLTTAQNRWFYYYSVNVSIILGFLIITTIDKTGITKLYQDYKKGVVKLDKFIDKNKNHIGAIVIVFMILLYVFIMPSYNATMRTAHYGIKSSGQSEWYESLTWLKDNTPNPGLNYNSIYTKSDLSYPNDSYGIMSWWDYGHMITYYGHRIPNANPFQAGIGGRENHLPGASTFFTAITEDQATQVLNDGKLNSKYIISNAYMAYSINNVMGVWNEEPITNYYTIGIVEGKQQMLPQKHWYETIEAKLHIFDGVGLQQYRLVHESIPNPYTSGGNIEQQMKYYYNFLYGGNVKISNSGYVKIFEFVNGTKITGINMDCSNSLIYSNVTTNQGRHIDYYQTGNVINNSISFKIPYSTMEPMPNETQFDVIAQPYEFVCGNVSAVINVPEYNVLDGNVVTVDFKNGESNV